MQNREISITPESRKKAGEILFFTALVLQVAIAVANSSMLAIPLLPVLYNQLIYHMIVIFIHFLVLIKIAIWPEGGLRQKIVLAGIYVLFLLQFFLVLGSDLTDRFPIQMAVMIIGAAGIDFGKTVKVYLAESLAAVFLMTVLAMVGYLPNPGYENGPPGVIRSSLGSVYPTDFAARIFFCILLFLVIWNVKVKGYQYILLAVLGTVVFAATFAKNNYICIVLTFVLFGIDRFIRSEKASDRIRSLWSRLISWAGTLFMPAAFAVIGIVSVFYDENKTSGLPFLFNRFLNNRILLISRGYKDFGIPVFGQKLTYIGSGGSTVFPENYNFIDCSYFYILFEYGVIATVLVIGAYIWLSRKYKNNIYIQYMLIMIAVACTVEHHLPDIAYNPALLLLFADYPTDIRKASDLDPEHLPHSRKVQSES